MMNILLGTALLLVVLALFTLFSYKAPQGMKAMGGTCKRCLCIILS